MAVFEVQGEDGKTYEVEAPDMREAIKAVSRVGQKDSLGRTLWENIVGDGDPNTQNFGEKVGSALNKAGESMTLGLVGDEASAAVSGILPGGMNYDERLQYESQQEEMLPTGVRVVAEIGGALIPALMTRGATGLPAASTIGGRVAQSAGLGASGAGIYSFMEGEDGLESRRDAALRGATAGGVVGGIIPGVGGAVNAVLKNRAANRAVREATRNAPTTEQLRAAGRALYDQVDNAGVQIRPESFETARQGIMRNLSDNGLDQLPGPGSLTPKTARVAQIAEDMSTAMADDTTSALPFSSLDQLRRHAGTAAQSAERTDSALGARFISELDDYVRSLGADDVVTGDIRALQTALPKARETWARMSRSQVIDDAIEASGNYVSGPASGIRNQFRRILNNPSLRKGYSAAEIRAMQKVINGSFPERLIHLFGGGLGQMATATGGAAMGGVPGFLAGSATAAGVRGASERIAMKNAETVRALIANGGMETLPTVSPVTRGVLEAMLRRNMASAAAN